MAGPPEKTMKKALVGFLLGLLLGVVLGVYGVRAFAPTVVAVGTVEHYSPSPGATLEPPEGYYVNSMVYIDGLTKDSLGQFIMVAGRLGSIPDTDHYRDYPKLFDIEKQ